ncbi:hypothetical protein CHINAEXTREME_18130 [Halobiforma lacisalsi AJ5]|uniref:Uncharacterized protein n=1 Tax=Natronobacterium lacisalsi AJ5 TaxID=358396 RepID=M0LDP7_NATLA|nr:hypothetical protein CHINAEXTREME_18130 [Halobiforma lacisalsi AJ5]EMA31697.1 hypothetical protein C445_14482 [Halobiforma lacisalsi AJ5]
MKEFVDRHGTDAARRLGIRINGDREPIPDELEEGVTGTVVVEIELIDTTPRYAKFVGGESSCPPFRYWPETTATHPVSRHSRYGRPDTHEFGYLFSRCSTLFRSITHVILFRIFCRFSLQRLIFLPRGGASNQHF